MNKIEDEVNKNEKYKIPDEVTYEEAWRIIRETNHCMMDSLFTGLKRSVVICDKCGHQSSN